MKRICLLPTLLALLFCRHGKGKSTEDFANHFYEVLGVEIKSAVCVFKGDRSANDTAERFSVYFLFPAFF